MCTHCANYLCDNCTSNHYNKLRDETISELNNCHETAVNIVARSEKLNNICQMKIYEYSNKKEQIKQLKQALLRQLELEEDQLIQKLESEILNEYK